MFEKAQDQFINKFFKIEVIGIPKSRNSTISSQNSDYQTDLPVREIISRINNRINEHNSRNMDTYPNANANDDREFLDMESVLTLQSDIDNNDEELRNEINSNFEDDEFFYADNEEAFQEELQKAQTEELTYEYDNVLNGSTNTFGLELEFSGGNADAIANELHELGICAHNRQVHYHAPSVEGKWKLERDSSVSGGELISPPLKDTPQTWQTLEKVCEVAKKHNAQIDFHCGGHVHIGIEPLDTARQRWRRFFKSTGSFEDVIYRVSGGDRGVVRPNVNHYAATFADNADRMLRTNFRLDNANDLNNLTINASRHDRYKIVNLTNIHNTTKPNTVEFRSFNGSLDPKIIQNNVRIANGILLASEKARHGNTAESQSMQRRGLILKNRTIGENYRNNHTDIRDFVDIAFTRKKDKDAVLKLYAKNSWFDR